MLFTKAVAFVGMASSVSATYLTFMPKCWKACARESGLMCQWGDLSCICSAANRGVIANSNTCACSSCGDVDFQSRLAMDMRELAFSCKMVGRPLNSDVVSKVKSAGECSAPWQAAPAPPSPPSSPPPPPPPFVPAAPAPALPAPTVVPFVPAPAPAVVATPIPTTPNNPAPAPATYTTPIAGLPLSEDKPKPTTEATWPSITYDSSQAGAALTLPLLIDSDTFGPSTVTVVGSTVMISPSPVASGNSAAKVAKASSTEAASLADSSKSTPTKSNSAKAATYTGTGIALKIKCPMSAMGFLAVLAFGFA